MAASTMNDYELQRQLRLEENRRRMEEMGLLQQKSILESFAPRKASAHANAAAKPAKQTWLARRPRVPLEPRRSKRLTGERVDYCEIGDNDVPMRCDSRGPVGDDSCGHACGGGYHELLDLMERGKHHAEESDSAAAAATAGPGPSSSQPDNSELQEQLQQIRCSSQGRGSVYDSSIGITCHFCRQKKLCGEENCPRCQHRDAEKECIGKTDCSRCHSAFGKFCRACLLIRYGQTLEEATEKMKAGTWLCPHCYEEENPDDGWICNSSICMKRRGLKPTGIAIYDAQQRGFKSVAHLLQAQLQKKGGIKALTAAAAGEAPEAPEEQAVAGTERPNRKSNGGGSNGRVEGEKEAGASGDGEETETDCECEDGHRGKSGAEAGPSSQAAEAEAAGTAGVRRGRGRPPRAPASKPGSAAAAGVASGRVVKARGAAAKAPAAAAVAEAVDAAASGEGLEVEDVPLAVRRSMRSRK